MTARPPATRTTHAFAMIVAIAMLAMVGVVLLALSQLTADVAIHGRHARLAAQLRQMLLSGQALAQRTLDASPVPPKAQSVPLPKPLAIRRGQLAIRYQPPAPHTRSRRVTIRARLGNMAAAQTLRFQRRNQHWQLVDARLTNAHRLFSPASQRPRH